MTKIHASRVHTPQVPDRRPPERAAGPDLAALAAGAPPTAEEMGSRVDLPGEIREKMENAFRADFSDVRIYESQTVADAGAEAVARGSDIAFAPGRLDLASTAGQALLGHELSHVVSQARGESTGRGFLNDAHLEAQADRQGMLAARGESVFDGPVSPIGTSAAAPASGPMQAKKKTTENAEKEAAREGRELPSMAHPILRSRMKEELLSHRQARIDSAQGEAQLNRASLVSEKNKHFDDVVDYWNEEKSNRENNVDRQNAQDEGLTRRAGGLAMAEVRYHESIRDALLSGRNSGGLPYMKGKPMDEHMERYFNSLIGEAAKIQDKDERDARVREIYSAFENNDRQALTGFVKNDVQNLSSATGFFKDIVSNDKNKAMEAYENNTYMADRIKALHSMLTGGSFDEDKRRTASTSLRPGLNELGLVDSNAKPEEQSRQQAEGTRTVNKISNMSLGVEAFITWARAQLDGEEAPQWAQREMKRMRRALAEGDYDT